MNLKININYIYKSLILLSLTNTYSLNDGIAAEKPMGISPEEERPQLSQIDLNFHATLSLLQTNCTKLMNTGTQTQDESQKIDYYLQAINLLTLYSNEYSKTYQCSSFSIEDKAKIIQTLYSLSENLYVCWANNVKLIMGKASESFYYTTLALTNIDRLVYLHMQFLKPEQIPSIHFPLAANNSLTHIACIFANFQQHLTDQQQVKQFVEAANTYFDMIKDHPTYKTIASANVQIIRVRQAQLEKPSNRNIKSGTNVARARNKQAFETQKQIAELGQQQYQSVGKFTPNPGLVAVIALKNKASTQWLMDHNLDNYKKLQANTYSKLCELENGIAHELKLERPSTSWTLEDFKKIYSYLKKDITEDALESRFDEFVTICLSANDIVGAETRLQAFAIMLGGSADCFEKIPSTLKFRYAILKYTQGEPETWEKCINKEIAEQTMKKEARKRQKEKKRAEMIRRELAQKAADQEKDTTKEIEKAAAPSAQTAPPNQSTPAAASSSNTITNTLPIIREDQHENLTAETKKLAKERLVKEQERHDKKSEKHKDQSHAEVFLKSAKDNVSAPQEPPKETSIKTFAVNNNVLKLYNNLYDKSPRLSSEEATQLLGGFGLTIHKDEGKGSHTKCFLNAGETITDIKGDKVWTCPNLEEAGLMTIVPRWDGKDIPPYMIKNIRFILKKIGIQSGITEVVSHSHKDFDTSN